MRHMSSTQQPSMLTRHKNPPSWLGHSAPALQVTRSPAGIQVGCRCATRHDANAGQPRRPSECNYSDGVRTCALFKTSLRHWLFRGVGTQYPCSLPQACRPIVSAPSLNMAPSLCLCRRTEVCGRGSQRVVHPPRIGWRRHHRRTNGIVQSSATCRLRAGGGDECARRHHFGGTVRLGERRRWSCSSAETLSPSLSA